MDLHGDCFECVGRHRLAPELVAGHLPLEPPHIAVNVEDAAPQQVGEDGGKGLPLGVVFEPGLEHVLDIFRVGGDGVAEYMDVDGLGGRVAKQMGVPITQIVELCGPSRLEVGVAYLTAAPWPHSH